MALDTLFMSANHLAGQDGEFEPQRQNNGLLFIEGLEVFGDTLKPVSVITLSIESFPIPKQRNDAIELQFLNQTRKVAGPGMVDEVELVLKDFVDRETALVMQNWRNAVYDPQSGRLGLARDYKKQGEVHLFSPNGAIERRYKLLGIWPSVVDPGDVDMTGTDKMIMNCTLIIDKFFILEGGGWNGAIKRPLAPA
jgi:hypothetical protein